MVHVVHRYAAPAGDAFPMFGIFRPACRAAGRRRGRAAAWSGAGGVPERAPSRAAIRSAGRSASSRYWVVRKVGTPSATRSRTGCHIIRRPRGSRPVAGSSRKIGRGRPTRVVARSSRRRMPRGRRGRLPAPSASSNRSSNSAARSRRPGPFQVVEAGRQPEASSPVSRSSTAENWPVTPIPRGRRRARTQVVPRPLTATAVPISSYAVCCCCCWFASQSIGAGAFAEASPGPRAALARQRQGRGNSARDCAHLVHLLGDFRFYGFYPDEVGWTACRMTWWRPIFSWRSAR